MRYARVLHTGEARRMVPFGGQETKRAGDSL